MGDRATGQAIAAVLNQSVNRNRVAVSPPDFIGETGRLFAAEVIRDYLDRLEKTKYLAPLDPDLEMDDLDELDDPDEDEPEPWLENPVMGAEELLRFARVRQLLRS